MRTAAPLLFLLTGCAAAAGLSDPPLAQLARWRDTARDAIAAEPVVAPCPAANPACRRLHALRAETCLGQALADRALGAACPASRAAPLLDCAAEAYAAALAAGATARTRAGANAGASTAAPADPDADAPEFRAGLAQALHCRAELDEPATAATRASAAAEAAAGAPPDLAVLHGARAALVQARVGPTAPQRCAAARRALGLASGAPPEHRARLHADALLHLGPCEASR